MPCAKRRAMRASKVSKWQSGKVAKRPRPAQTTHRQALHKQEPSAAPSGTNRAVRAVHRQGDASGCCTERRGRGRVPPGGGSNQVEAAHPGSRALTSSEVTCTPQESLRARTGQSHRRRRVVGRSVGIVRTGDEARLGRTARERDSRKVLICAATPVVGRSNAAHALPFRS